MPEYKLLITVEGKDQASGPLGNVGGALGMIGTFVTGNLLAGGLSNLGSAITGLGRDAIGAASQMQNLTLAIETLVAKEISRGTEVEQSTQRRITLTETERDKLAGLILKRDELGIRLKEETLRHQDLVNQWGAEGLATRRHAIDMAQLQREYDKTAKSVNDLQARDGKLVTVIEKVRTGQMTMTDALKQAGPETQRLLGFLRDLSLISPFEYQDVAATLQLQMAFGQTAKTAEGTTAAILDIAAGLGMTRDEFQRFSYNLAQIGSQGKITALDIRQLSMTRFGMQDLSNVFETLSQKTGVVIKDHEDFNKAIETGQITTDDFYKALADYAKRDYAGAAERMSKTLTGLQSSFSDLFFFAASDLLTPALETVTEALSGVFDWAQDLVKSGVLKDIGKQIGSWIGEFLTNVISLAQTYGPQVLAWFQQLASQVMPILSNVMAFVVEHWQAFAGAIAGVAAFLAGGALVTAIGTVVGVLESVVSVTAAVAAAFALLGAAWAEDWGGIRTSTMEAWEESIKPALLELAAWLQERLPIFLADLALFWETTLLPAIQQVFAFIADPLIPLLGQLAGWLITNLPGAIETLATFWTTTLFPALEDIASFIKSDVVPALEVFLAGMTAVWQFAQDWIIPILNVLATVIGEVLKNQVEGIIKSITGWQKILEVVLPILGNVAKMAGVTMFDGFQRLLDLMKRWTKGAKGVWEAVKKIVEWLRALIYELTQVDLPSWMKPGSPSPWEVALRGVGNALQDVDNLMGNANNWAMVPAPAGGGRPGAMSMTVYGGAHLYGVQSPQGFMEEMQNISQV